MAATVLPEGTVAQVMTCHCLLGVLLLALLAEGAQRDATHLTTWLVLEQMVAAQGAAEPLTGLTVCKAREVAAAARREERPALAARAS
jgi:hypothetical protein